MVYGFLHKRKSLRKNNPIVFLSLFLYFAFLQPCLCYALTPDEVLVLANTNASSSVGLAKYYMKQRNIPQENLVQLWLTDKETCSREAYERKVIPRIRKYLASQPNIRAMVTMYGIPLRIQGPPNTSRETLRINQLKNQIQKAPNPKAKKTAAAALTRYKQSLDRTAAFDSELALVQMEDYDLGMWQPNPFFVGYKHPTGIDKSRVIMTSRLDGPTPASVKRMITDAISAEKEGLSGTAYFDARWKYPASAVKGSYALYDKSIHNTANHLKKSNILPVVLDDTPQLFSPGQCKQTALYCGWYSLARYIDSFEWVKGSVGFHIASSECTTLKNPKSQVWCKKMIEKGITATVGPVGEPYVEAFPIPEAFFGLLTEGYLTLAEAYLASVPHLSWKMVLIGDPLYRMRLVPVQGPSS